MQKSINFIKKDFKKYLKSKLFIYFYIENFITESSKTHDVIDLDSVGNDLESDDLQRLNDLTLQSPNVLQPLNDLNEERALKLTTDSAVSDCNESK